jgi:hypothetical protein
MSLPLHQSLGKSSSRNRISPIGSNNSLNRRDCFLIERGNSQFSSRGSGCGLIRRGVAPVRRQTHREPHRYVLDTYGPNQRENDLHRRNHLRRFSLEKFVSAHLHTPWGAPAGNEFHPKRGSVGIRVTSLPGQFANRKHYPNPSSRRIIPATSVIAVSGPSGAAPSPIKIGLSSGSATRNP